jgi:hypothetical protein
MVASCYMVGFLMIMLEAMKATCISVCVYSVLLVYIVTVV